MKRFIKIFPYLLIIIGIVPLLYWGYLGIKGNEARNRSYAAYTKNQNTETANNSETWALINAFNENKTKENYDKLDEVIGWLTIEDLSLKYPIYRYATEDSLDNGLAHYEDTDIPSNEITDTFIMGHNGTYGEDFFTHLSDLKEDDEVKVTILDRTYTYKVIYSEVTEPDKLNDYKSDKSTLTLITCTPYGTNTHRLLVHCEES